MTSGNASSDVTFNVTSNDTLKVCLNEYCIPEDEYLDQLYDYVMPTTFEWLILLFYALVFLVGVIGNLLVCYAIARNLHMRSVTNVFIVNLSIADLLVIIFCLIPTALEDVTETWYMGLIACKIVKFIQVGDQTTFDFYFCRFFQWFDVFFVDLSVCVVRVNKSPISGQYFCVDVGFLSIVQKHIL